MLVLNNVPVLVQSTHCVILHEKINFPMNLHFSCWLWSCFWPSDEHLYRLKCISLGVLIHEKVEKLDKGNYKWWKLSSYLGPDTQVLLKQQETCFWVCRAISSVPQNFIFFKMCFEYLHFRENLKLKSNV